MVNRGLGGDGWEGGQGDEVWRGREDLDFVRENYQHFEHGAHRLCKLGRRYDKVNVQNVGIERKLNISKLNDKEFIE